MSKPPEEGLVWEWRAFGRIGDSLASRVRARPVRLGVLDQAGEDIYFISPASDQNVKLRKWRGLWLLKLKLLLKSGPHSIELYSESSRMMFAFPVPRSTLDVVAQLLAVKLPGVVEQGFSFEQEQFTEALVRSSPPATVVEVSKVRSQFDFESGWVELADVKFSGGDVQTISIHSPQMETVEEILEELSPDPRLEVMNYVAACRRWGAPPDIDITTGRR